MAGLRYARICFFVSLAIAVQGTKSSHVKDLSSTSHFSILLVSPPFSGHVIPFLALGGELVKRGHNVTLVTAPTQFILREAEKYNINLWSIEQGGQRLIDETPRTNDASDNIHFLLNLSATFQEVMLKTIDNTAITSFDIIVADTPFFTSLVCFSRKWNISSANLLLSLSLNPFDIHAWPFPSVFSGYTDNFTFSQRLVSTISAYVSRFIIKREITNYYSFAGEMCKSVNIPFSHIMHYPDYLPLIITTSFGFEFPRVTLPLTDYVGPVLSQSQPQLPQDIAEWLEPRGPRSVVYVSMGSMVIITSEQAQMLISGATQANLSVVWSLRKSNQHILQHMTYDPDSVLIAEWIPQVTVLKHPSIHSAILHGGLGGIQEALSCGVPMIAVPYFADQLDNAARVQYYHYGEMVTLPKLTAPLVMQKLRLIGSELYRKSVKKIQQIYKKDGGVSRAADLVEFYSDVGYDHLVPSYVKYNWSWIEYHNVDVYAVLILSVLLPSYLLYRILRSCCSSKSKKKME